jgi:hypothetical protein
MDHAAGAEEEQRLEEGVGIEVEHADAVGLRHGEADEHVAELTDGGVRQHPLDVVLHQRDGGGEERGEAPNVAHHRQRSRIRGGGVDREEPRYQIDACRHHRRGVDQRAHRRRAFHRVRQPDVQRELRGLAHRAAEDQDHRRGDDELVGMQRRRVQLDEVERARRHEEQQDADHEAEVAQARGDEGFERGGRRIGAVVPEADQQVRAEAHQLPADEDDQEVRRQYEDQHREREDAQFDKEA